MDWKKGWIIEAGVIAIGLAVLGFCLKAGIDNYIDRGRVVSVKGLAETEVAADKVTWPIVFKEMGDDLPSLYNRVSNVTQSIKKFLIANGLTEDEISVNPPKVDDYAANQYASNINYRYYITGVITVTSSKVEMVRTLMVKQSELLQQGIAIVDGGYENGVTYEYTKFNELKPKMLEEATQNARKSADEFAKNSDSTVGKIVSANQGVFSIENRDDNSPHIKKIRVVTSIDYQLNN